MPHPPIPNELPPPPPIQRDTGGRCVPTNPTPAPPNWRDPIVENVRKKLLDRSQVGIAKYGVGLNREDLTELEWLIHHQEELLDAANYTERRILDLIAANEEKARDEARYDRNCRIFQLALLIVVALCVAALAHMCITDRWPLRLL